MEVMKDAESKGNAPPMGRNMAKNFK